LADDISLVRFGVTNFFAVLMNSPVFRPTASLLIKLVSSLVASEPQPDKKNQERLDWLYQHTNKRVDVSLPVVELAVFKNLDRGLSREIDIGDETYHLVELYKYLDEISKELATMVIAIAKKYSIDIPLSNYGSKSQSIHFDEK
jgi:hypothetical protein